MTMPRLGRAALLAGSALAIAGAAQAADPISKFCKKDGEFLIGFAQANNAEPYRQHVNDELTAAAKAVPNFTLQIADGQGNVNTQTSQVDNFITQKVDLLLISPFEAAPLTPAVKRAMDAGIPVIELDRKTNGDPGKDYTAFIGGDNYKIALADNLWHVYRLIGKLSDRVYVLSNPGVTAKRHARAARNAAEPKGKDDAGIG